MKIAYLIITLLLSGIFAVQCQQNYRGSDRSNKDSTTSVENQGIGTAWAGGSFKSNGERIYFTSTSDRGTEITYTGGPAMGMMMMGGRLACVSCHGLNARGGKHMMHMEVMDAPGIRWTTLTRMKREELGNGENDKSIGVYTFEDFKKEVINHKELNGEELKEDMPQWQMSDKDLKDLMDYLESLN